MRRPSQDQNQGHSPSILCFCSSIESLHLHQYHPHCALSSTISAISSIPIHSILLLPLWHFWNSQGFPPTDQRRHKRNWPLTRDVLGSQEEHRCAGLLRPFSTLLHLHQKLHYFSSRFFCHVQRNFWVESVTSHSCFLPCTLSMPCPSRLPSISESLPHIPSIPHSSMACSAYFELSRHIANALPIPLRLTSI